MLPSVPLPLCVLLSLALPLPPPLPHSGTLPIFPAMAWPPLFTSFLSIYPWFMLAISLAMPTSPGVAPALSLTLNLVLPLIPALAPNQLLHLPLHVLLPLVLRVLLPQRRSPPLDLPPYGSRPLPPTPPLPIPSLWLRPPLFPFNLCRCRCPLLLRLCFSLYP